MGGVGRALMSFGPTQRDANGRLMKSLDRRVQQELGKKGKERLKAARLGPLRLGEVDGRLGKREGEERGGVSAKPGPGMSMQSGRHLCL